MFAILNNLNVLLVIGEYLAKSINFHVVLTYGQNKMETRINILHSAFLFGVYTKNAEEQNLRKELEKNIVIVE